MRYNRLKALEGTFEAMKLKHISPATTNLVVRKRLPGYLAKSDGDTMEQFKGVLFGLRKSNLRNKVKKKRGKCKPRHRLRINFS